MRMMMMIYFWYHSWLFQIVWSRTDDGVHGLTKSEDLYSRQVLVMKDGQDDHTKFIIVIMMMIGRMIMLTNIWRIILNNQHPPSSKDIFYELENLSEIKDRTILKLFETDGSGRGALIIGIVITIIPLVIIVIVIFIRFIKVIIIIVIVIITVFKTNGHHQSHHNNRC